jgi:HEPN domain-containing protein
LDPRIEVPSAVREVVELSDYAVQMRYPGDYYPIREEEYRRAVALAAQVVRWVESRIQPKHSSQTVDSNG